ncbi:hypothetical protein RND81_03G179100 [Saponaria officinalis]|uniref:Uncharacterized protein n=1 Tax=Saponaria officinalis TaxID=3572 RepID=A0AAW1M924_SAPOF
MGNYASCTLGGVNGKHNKVARVILPSGEIKQFNHPTKAAELMLEIPNYFLINSTSLQLGRRISPLIADEDLEFGDVYVMFPMQRVNSIVNAADLAALYLAAKRGSTRAGKVRVVPACSVEVKEVDKVAHESDARQGKAVLEGVEELLSEFQHRRSVSRSKKPLLETIVEEPVYKSRSI